MKIIGIDPAAWHTQIGRMRGLWLNLLEGGRGESSWTKSMLSMMCFGGVLAHAVKYIRGGHGTIIRITEPRNLVLTSFVTSDVCQ